MEVKDQAASAAANNQSSEAAPANAGPKIKDLWKLASQKLQDVQSK